MHEFTSVDECKTFIAYDSNNQSVECIATYCKRVLLDSILTISVFYFRFALDTEGTSRAPVPKPLIKINPKKHQAIEQQKVECETDAIKERPIEDEAVQKQGRGNCYTEPMHQNNCVQSELYMLT